MVTLFAGHPPNLELVVLYATMTGPKIKVQ